MHFKKEELKYHHF